MASIEIGSSAVSGPFTPLIAPSGSGIRPTSAYSQSEGPLLTSAGVFDAADYGKTTEIKANSSTVAALSGAPVVTYVMCGEDKNVYGSYDTWKVTGTPDYAGASYAGALATPLRNVTVLTTQ